MSYFSYSRVLPCLSLSLLALASAHCEHAPQPGDVVANGSSAGAPPVTRPNAGTGGSVFVAGGSGGSPSAGGVGAMSAASSGGSAGMEPRGPTPATGGANFPFPQNRHSPHCSYPNYRNSDVKAAYEKWKADTVTGDGAGGFLRVKRPKEPGLEVNSTVSEGIAYGMLLAVYMNDQPLFDGLWKYEQLWLSEHGLMNWYIRADGTGLGSNPDGGGAASDADEDMAWALVMADRQWGGKGSLGDSYSNIAKKQIELVYNHEIQDDKLLKPGDSWGGWSTANPSYFAPSYYRVFAKVSGNEKWNQVLQTSYEVLEKSLNAANGNMTNGLVPAWCTGDGVPNSVFDGAPTHYQYDSCRTPFRIALDYCQNGEPRAQSYVAKTSQFFAGIGAKQIVDGYDLNGTPRPQYQGGQSAAFVGPAAVGAMSNASFMPFIQDGYDGVATMKLLVGGDYYDESWTVLSLLMMSGNFLDYTAISPL